MRGKKSSFIHIHIHYNIITTPSKKYIPFGTHSKGHFLGEKRSFRKVKDEQYKCFIHKLYKLRTLSGSSQWLGFWTFIAAAWVLSLVWKLRSFKPCSTANHSLPHPPKEKTFILMFINVCSQKVNTGDILLYIFYVFKTSFSNHARGKYLCLHVLVSNYIFLITYMRNHFNFAVHW